MYSSSRLVIAEKALVKNRKNGKLRRPGETRQRLGYQVKGVKENESSLAARNSYFI